MPKLHQILAVESGVRTQTGKDLKKATHGLDNETLLSGLERTYAAMAEDGEQLQPERQRLQVRTPLVLEEVSKIMAKQFDIVGTRDFANMIANADVVVDGKVLIKSAPPPFLLWLEKQLVELHSTICTLPLLPADIDWVFDTAQDCYKNKNEIKTHRTKKIEDFRIVVQADENHPAQIAKITKDEIAGHWTSIRYSGALARTDVMAMKDRIEELIRAVKYAREQANSVEVENQKFGKGVLDFVFGG